MTRWLDRQEQTAWRAYLDSTIRVQAEMERDLRAMGLTHAYYEILVRLSEAPGRQLRMSALAERSVSSRSRLSHAVARLEEQGLVRREECATDRRGQVCHLTDAGLAVLEDAAPVHVATVRRVLLDPLTSTELRTLGEISATISAHLDGDGEPEPGPTPGR